MQKTKLSDENGIRSFNQFNECQIVEINWPSGVLVEHPIQSLKASGSNLGGGIPKINPHADMIGAMVNSGPLAVSYAPGTNLWSVKTLPPYYNQLFIGQLRVWH